MKEIATSGQQGFCFRTTSRQDDMFTDTDSIAGKPKRLGFRHYETSGRSNTFGKSLLPIVVEGGWKV
jgi:hypothetical protein